MRLGRTKPLEKQRERFLGSAAGRLPRIVPLVAAEHVQRQERFVRRAIEVRVLSARTTNII